LSLDLFGPALFTCFSLESTNDHFDFCANAKVPPWETIAAKRLRILTSPHPESSRTPLDSPYNAGNSPPK